jgi:hypothetical protein
MQKHHLVLRVPCANERRRVDADRQKLTALKRARATVREELLTVERRIAALRAAGVPTEPDPAAVTDDSSTDAALRNVVLRLFPGEAGAARGPVP